MNHANTLVSVYNGEDNSDKGLVLCATFASSFSGSADFIGINYATSFMCTSFINTTTDSEAIVDKNISIYRY